MKNGYSGYVPYYGMIVSGDKHLLSLGSHYQGIAIVTAAQAVARVEGG